MSAKKGEINNFDLEDDLEEESNSKTGNDDFKKQLIKLAVIIGGGICALILILSIASIFTKKSYTYEEIEEIMTQAAKNYFAENPTDLSKAEKVIVPVANLVVAGKMSDLSEYVPEGVICTGSVTAAKVGTEYVYTPMLDCGEAYSSTPLVDKIMQDSPLTTSGYGLYSMNNEKVFRGEDVNNYVQLEKALWRIVKLSSDNSIILIKDTKAGYASVPWDDRYNDTVGYNVGKNDYSMSRIKDYMNTLYNLEKEDEIFLSANDKAKLMSQDVCVGARATAESNNTNAVECKKRESNQKLVLLAVSDYINASLDPNCKTSENQSCQNYNYLAQNFNWWLTTPVVGVTDRAYSVNTKGEIKSTPTADYCYIRPVIKLSSSTTVKSGTGTATDPYIIK